MKHGTATRRILTVLLIALGLAGATRPATAQDYDLVILNGRVMDPETMLDATLNVGVKDGRIAVITKDAITGSETIDATGLVVAPGFIDTHFHALDGLSIRLSALDGHTTGMDLEAGGLNIDEWYASKKDAWPLNYGTTVSHEGARMTVHDPELD
jgi:predicted amidohydrolase YtcJ